MPHEAARYSNTSALNEPRFHEYPPVTLVILVRKQENDGKNIASAKLWRRLQTHAYTLTCDKLL